MVKKPLISYGWNLTGLRHHRSKLKIRLHKKSIKSDRNKPKEFVFRRLLLKSEIKLCRATKFLAISESYLI